MVENQMVKMQREPNEVCNTSIQIPTVGENINRQIEQHLAAIARLEATRASLGKANLLDIKISDLREAMCY